MKAIVEIVTLDVKDIVTTSPDAPVDCNGDMGGCAFL